MNELNKTPLFYEHQRLGANMVPFAGFEMPLVYSSMIEEHQSVRMHAGLFDVSHMGEIEINGKDAIAFTNYLISHRSSDMLDGDIRYSPLCYAHGGQVDDLLAYRINSEKMMLVVNASNIDKDFAHIQQIRETRNDLQVTINNVSGHYGQIALQGPRAETFLQAFTEFDLSDLKVFKFDEIIIDGIKTITSRTGYTGEDGFEILAKTNDIVPIWTSLLKRWGDEGLKPCGLGSRDTLRFEACLWLYGNDIDETITPLEAGQTFAVKLDKDFVGRDALQTQKDQGIKRSFCAMLMDNKQIPRHGMPIHHEGKAIGFVSSGTYCPAIQKTACLGYVPPALNQPGQQLGIDIRGKEQTATVVSKPFYKGTAGRKDRR
jgi:aminomethyltransferase